MDKVFTKRRASEKAFTNKEPSHLVLTLSSDSESSHDGSSIKVEEVLDKKLLIHDAKPIKEENEVPSTSKSPKKKLKKEDPEKKKKLESQLKEEGRHGCCGGKYSRETNCTKFVIFKAAFGASRESTKDKGDSIDLSGDVGAVGRIVISDGPSGKHDMLFDLKGTTYKTTILPSRTFFVVSFGQTEAKVEAIMNDFIQLKPQSNVYEAETMVEGTLDGFTFDSDEEAENLRRPASQG